MVLKGTMPASSHGLPTSATREDKPPHFSQRILTASMYGRCGEFPSKVSQPSTARFFNSSAADHREVLALVANPNRQSEPPETFLRDHPVAHVVQPIQFARFALGWNPEDGWHRPLNP